MHALSRSWQRLRRPGLAFVCRAQVWAVLVLFCGMAAGAPQPTPPPRGFLGYTCHDERCASHKAGFDWAERNGITQARSCFARNDTAFAEGCRAFAEETVTAEQAGFEWARENDLGDASQCAGAGPGFEAGCQAYVHGFAD